MLSLKPDPRGGHLEPLTSVTVRSGTPGTLVVCDARGRAYARQAKGRALRFRVAGALGTHVVRRLDAAGREQESLSFQVDCETGIQDKGGAFAKLMNDLRWTMIGWHGEAGTIRHNGKFYHFFVRWLRDHVHTMKGMKYFYPELKTGIDLYADTQRQDGMIWDNVYPHGKHKSMWDTRFEYGNFIRPIEKGTYELKRIPVENDVEYLFIEGLYYTWKACGDDAWMAGLLDKALKAVKYSTTDVYRWSRKYKLLKRGYTIDTWDFQNKGDAATFKGDAMCVHPKKTRFGVMHGDNTGFAVGCQYLAEMLAHVGRTAEARRMAKLGKEIKQRLDRIAWNGKFYTHHVPEDKRIKRDFGVDESKQVSLSNAYALNRGLTHKQCVAIIKTYQAIRRRMPSTSPGEWYQIYPPFEKGFGGHGGLWQYMNGGVTTIVAGELAHGAFEHGFEAYGVDILTRLAKLGERDDGYFHCCYRGAMPRPPKRRFRSVSLKTVANADFKGKTKKGVLGWTDEGDNDLARFPAGSQRFADVPFSVIKPAQNGRRAVLALSNRKGFADQATLPIGKKARSLYLLHTMGGGPLAGMLTMRYADGSHDQRYIREGQVYNWWGAVDPVRPGNGGRRNNACRLAWVGSNSRCNCLGVYVLGVDNPHPNKTITALEFKAAEDGTRWMVLGVTLSDQAAYFAPSHISFGIPDNWGAAAVVYALIEGLAGIKDTGVAYDQALLAPRWEAAAVKAVTATAKYEASGGYVRYTYARQGNKLALAFTSSGETVDVRVLLPHGKKVKAVRCDGQVVKHKLRKVESSTYACFKTKGIGVRGVEVRLG